MTCCVLQLADRGFTSIGSGSYGHTIDRFSRTGLAKRAVPIEEAPSSEIEQVLAHIAHAALTNEPGAVGDTIFSHCGFLCRQKNDRPAGRSLKWGRMKSNIELNCPTGMVKCCLVYGFVWKHSW